MTEASGKTVFAILGFVDADKAVGAISTLTDSAMKTLDVREEVIITSDTSPQEKDDRLSQVYEGRLKAIQRGTENLTRHQSQILCLIFGVVLLKGLNLPAYGIRKAVEYARNNAASPQ